MRKQAGQSRLFCLYANYFVPDHVLYFVAVPYRHVRVFPLHGPEEFSADQLAFIKC